MTAQREVREDQHGTATGYNYGCRCGSCRRAFNAYQGRESLAGDCAQTMGDGKGYTSRCIVIAGRIAAADAELRRVAKQANRSEAAYRRWAERLAAAKADRDRVRQQRDEHMAECDAAIVRFGSAA